MPPGGGGSATRLPLAAAGPVSPGLRPRRSHNSVLTMHLPPLRPSAATPLRRSRVTLDCDLP